jgi:PhnB protein
MKETNSYLNFDGNCREAMTFYGKCLQAEPCFTPFSAGPPEMAAAATTTPDRILHAELATGPVVLMASDTLPGMPFRQGNNFSISISCESQLEMETLFAAFSENGKVTMPMHDAFWGGRFGMLTDRFGISWMFSFRAPGQHA